MLSRIVLVASVLILAACAVPVAEPPPSPPPASAPSAGPSPAVRPPPPPRPPGAALRRLDPAQLTGMTAEQAIAFLGKPQAEEPQNLGRLWHWRAGTCTLTLALYPEVDGRVSRVLTHDFTGTTDPGACLAALRREGAGHDR